MKHKVKVTVLTRNYILNYSSNISLIQNQEPVHVIMWAMNLFFCVMRERTITGILA